MVDRVRNAFLGISKKFMNAITRNHFLRIKNMKAAFFKSAHGRLFWYGYY